jgi:hypothetical protein
VISRSNLKFVIGLSLISLLILFSVLIPDFILWLFHSLYVLGHTLFELLEETLDIIIETLFGTGLHETQIIVFYILMTLAFLALYKLIRVMPRWYRNITQSLVDFYAIQKEAVFTGWQQLSLFGKIKWITLFMAGLYGLSLLFM